MQNSPRNSSGGFSNQHISTHQFKAIQQYRLNLSPCMPPLSPSPRLSQRLSGSKSSSNILGTVLTTAGDHGSEPTNIDSSAEQRVDSEKVNVADVSASSDNLQESEKVVQNDVSVVSDSPTVFKHPTHLVTPSEIFSKSALSSTNSNTPQGMNVQDVAAYSDAEKFEVEVKVVGLAWLDDQMPVVLTSTGQLNLFAEGRIVEQKVLELNPVLRAFGNAKTRARSTFHTKTQNTLHRADKAKEIRTKAPDANEDLLPVPKTEIEKNGQDALFLVRPNDSLARRNNDSEASTVVNPSQDENVHTKVPQGADDENAIELESLSSYMSSLGFT
ncbi:hypothetical protein KIW84_065830 [Lathyrus oleraceus]|uniref:Uncharacterized protein n=1 Tax=Pisum sativum TaxID=3888 RepID=A0A9D4WGI3_PEA|nr:hypothetical protein KIW84_065830 [Pisum sativum]